MSSRKPGKYGESLGWDEAVELVGGAEPLKEGVPYSTWQDWKRRDEVPAYRVLRIVRPRLVAPTSQGERTPSEMEVLFMALSPREQARCFPLLRSIVTLSRTNEDTFGHLVKQIRLLLQAEAKTRKEKDLIAKLLKMEREALLAAAREARAAGDT